MAGRFIMILEAVTVCVNYGDFLAWTLPANKHVFGYNKWGQSNWVIVTDKRDHHTKRVCDYHNVRCIQTDAFYEGGQSFNKANGINAGLEVLGKRGWVLHLDADIYLPPETQGIIPKLELDPECIYGFDRFNCRSFEDFAHYLTIPRLSHENWIFAHTNLFEMATRVVAYKGEGYIPIGFGQLWNPSKSKIKKYPDKHDTAARTDMQFAKMWSRDKRRFIPDFIGIHLESEVPTKMGVNWNGRTTIPFGPKSFVEEELLRRQHAQEIEDEVNNRIKWYKDTGRKYEDTY